MIAHRILVLEDDNTIGTLLAEMLEMMGHIVCAIATTEADAVAAAARYEPDLMIADIHLGEESGVAAVARILLSGPVAHVFVSGDTSWAKAPRPGAVVLQKPYREADLTRAIDKAFNGKPKLGVSSPV